MNIRYPVRKADGREYKNYDELLTDMRKNAHGWWLIGVKSKKESIYDCKIVGIDRLSVLSAKLACDKDSTLGCEQ